MKRRLIRRRLTAVTLLVSMAALCTVADHGSSHAAGPAAHFIVLGPKGDGLAKTEASVARGGRRGACRAGRRSASWSRRRRAPTSPRPCAACRACRVRAPRARSPSSSAGGGQRRGELGRREQIEQVEARVDTAAAFATGGASEPLAAEPVGHAADQSRRGQRRLRRQPGGARRRAGLGRRGDTPGPGAEHRRLELGRLRQRGCAGHVSGSLGADEQHARHARRRHDRGRANGIGIAGVAPNVRIASVKVIDDDGFIYPEYAICGFVWAADHGIDVTNNSYFVDPWFKWCNDDPDQKAVAEAVKPARRLLGAQRRGQRRRARQQQLGPVPRGHRQRQPQQPGARPRGSSATTARRCRPSSRASSGVSRSARPPQVVLLELRRQRHRRHRTRRRPVQDARHAGRQRPHPVDHHRRWLGLPAGHLDGLPARGRSGGADPQHAPDWSAGKVAS